MAAPNSNLDAAPDDFPVAMSDVVRFVRQLSHDLRNQLNAADLQAAFLKEVATDAETKQEVQRLRATLGEMTGALQQLTQLLVRPKLTEMAYEAAVFIEDFENKLRSQSAERSEQLLWNVQVGDAMLCIDPQLLMTVFLELIENAFQHGRGSGPINIDATANGEMRVTITEPKANFAESTDDWGRAPFRKLKHGHYGLGLPRARHIIEAHRGRFEARHDSSSSSLITTVALPVIGRK